MIHVIPEIRAAPEVTVDHNATISGFSDADGAWYTPYVAAAKAAGIVHGDSEGTFRPNDYVTRAEFAKMILCAKGLTVDKETAASGFSDADGEWYTPYVAAAKSAGLIYGYTDGTFRPNNNITRAEAAALSVR